MACSNCEGGNQLGATQGNLVAWVQPGGAGPRNPVAYAMAEGGNYPAIKVTGVSRKRRGARTPIYRRSGLNPRRQVRVGETVGVTPVNAITLQFAENSCGGYSPQELLRCELDVYQQHLCCGDGGEFETGWSKIDIWTGIDPESDDYSDQVSFVAEEDAALTTTHPGEFRDKLTIYPLVVSEIAASAGIATGTIVSGVVYADKENCGDNCGGNQGCTDQWYAVTNLGRVIYKKNKHSAITSNAIGAYPPNTLARVALLGNKIFISYFDNGVNAGYYWANLDSDGDPGSWTKVIVSTTFIPIAWVKVGNKLQLIGETTTTSRALVYEVSNSTAWRLLFASTANDTGIIGAMECDGKVVAVGRSGSIFISSCQGVWGLAPSTPTANDLRRISARTNNEWWVSDNETGAVYFSEDQGQNWSEVTFPFSGTGAGTTVIWANRNVGYVTHVNAGAFSIYTTWDGGLTWVNGNATNDRIVVSAIGGASVSQLQPPCCSNMVEQSNTFLLAGALGGSIGAIWQAEIQQCS